MAEISMEDALGVLTAHSSKVKKGVAEKLREICSMLEGEQAIFGQFGFPKELADAYNIAKHLIPQLDPPEPSGGNMGEPG